MRWQQLVLRQQEQPVRQKLPVLRKLPVLLLLPGRQELLVLQELRQEQVQEQLLLLSCCRQPGPRPTKRRSVEFFS